MKTIRIDTYDRFVCDGRNYYPRVWQGTLYLPNFRVNDGKIASHHHKTLIIESIVVMNSKGLLAVSWSSLNRYGLQKRWFYWRCGKPVTWHRLTWDERRAVCRAFRLKCDSDRALAYHKAPVRAWLSWALL